MPQGEGTGGGASRAQAEKDDADRAARATRQEKEGLRHANLQDSPLRCRRVSAAVRSDFVLNFQDRNLTVATLAEEYKQRYQAGWLDNTIPIPPISEILLAP
ncbi:hypothetical protein LIER_06886 [Lithospermum erythrorhizon]|uniref:Uncharacterized protein n=1 Tax=Lithospermum erythrorhizon TaxID=34254 RepID=A0AAV3PAT7_LITER